MAEIKLHKQNPISMRKVRAIWVEVHTHLQTQTRELEAFYPSTASNAGVDINSDNNDDCDVDKFLNNFMEILAFKLQNVVKLPS